MTDLVLAGLLVAFLAYHAFTVHVASHERSKLLNAVIAKNEAEFRSLELADKVKEVRPNPPSEPDLIPIADLTDQEFEEHIAREIA